MKERIYKELSGLVTCRSCNITIRKARHTKFNHGNRKILCNYCVEEPLLGTIRKKLIKFFSEEERIALRKLALTEYSLFNENPICDYP